MNFFRGFVLAALGMVAFTLLVSESDNMTAFFISKAIGFALALVVGYFISKKP